MAAETREGGGGPEEGADVFDKEGWVTHLKERLPLHGFHAHEKSTNFRFLALPEEWHSSQEKMLRLLQQVFQYDKRLEQQRFKLARSPAFNPDKLPGDWGFFPIPNPQGLHITISSGLSSPSSSSSSSSSMPSQCSSLPAVVST